MTLNRAYRFRLEPNSLQEQGLYRLAGSRRFVYNWGLDLRKNYYATMGTTPPSEEISRLLTHLKERPETAWLQEADSQLIQQAVKDVDRSFQNFFAKRAKFPKFQSKKQGRYSFRIPQRVKVESGKVYCPKIGWIKIRQSQEIEGATKSATFKRTADDHWFVTLVAEFEMPDVPLPEPKTAVGIDLGLHDFVTLSNGESVPAPKFFRKSAVKLKRAQRVLSRRKPGSKRRAKAKLKVAKVHQKISYQRGDFVHKLTTGLVRKYDAICIENLNVSALAKTKLRGHSKSILDAAFGEFERQLKYKTAWNRKHLGQIDRWFPSSKLCHGCGAVNDALTLSDRTWLCGCGKFHNRDFNASRNILTEGLRVLAAGHADNQNARGRRIRPATAGNVG